MSRRIFQVAPANINDHFSRGEMVAMEQGFIDIWTEAIEEDDLSSIQQIYRTCSPDHQLSLLYDQLPPPDLDPCGHANPSCGCYLKLPKEIHNHSLSLAVASKAKNVLLFLISKNSELKGGAWISPFCYIIHSIVFNAYFIPSEEMEYVELFEWSKSVITEEHLIDLLRVENCNGLYPLELAAQLDRFALFEAIFSTNNIYVKRRIKQNLLTYTWYDVTDYEHPQATRRDKSPLHFFSQTDRDKILEPSVSKYLCSPLVTKWFHAKCTAMTPPLTLLSLMDLLKFVLLILTAGSENAIAGITIEHNTSYTDDNYSCYMKMEHRMKVSLLILLLLLQFLYFVMAAVYMYHEQNVKRKLFTRLNVKHPLSTLTFFKYNAFVFTASVFIKTGSILLRISGACNIPLFLVNLSTIVLALTFPWVVLFFVQLTPIGYFVSIIQNMLKDVLQFVIIFFLFLETFALCFLDVLSSGGQDCTKGAPGFTSISSSLYAIFSVMLNMIPMESYRGADDQLSLKILHIVFVMAVPIVLINFLVGLFADSVQRVTQIKDLALCFQRYNAILIPDYLFSLFTPNLYRRRQRIAFAEENDRYYIVLTSAARPFNISILN